MTHTAGGRTPYLVVETAGSDEGRRINLTGDHLTVGRLPTCDVRFEDPRISRTHAALWQRAGADYVEDLGSSAGTFVNGELVTAPRQLQRGDRVAFAELQLRYSDGDLQRPRSSGRVPPPAVNYEIAEQRAHAINNVGRDQYNSYSQQVIQQRENFFREIAATRTKARWLIWIGLGVFVAGLGIALAGGYSFFGLIVEFWGSSTPPTPDDLRGFLVAALGSVINAVGGLLIIIGIVLHIVATSRRKRVDRQLPPPPPPQYRAQRDELR